MIIMMLLVTVTLLPTPTVTPLSSSTQLLSDDYDGNSTCTPSQPSQFCISSALSIVPISVMPVSLD